MDLEGAKRLRDAVRVHTDQDDHVSIRDVRLMMRRAFEAGESYAISTHKAFKAGTHLTWVQLDAILFAEVEHD